MLAESLKTVLASHYAFVIKAQFFHWNVEGPDFAQLHEFFGNIYEEVYGNTIDRCAEFIRVLDDYAPDEFSTAINGVVLNSSECLTTMRLEVLNALQNSVCYPDRSRCQEHA